MCLFSQSLKLVSFISATKASEAVSVSELHERVPSIILGDGTDDSQKRNIRNMLIPLVQGHYVIRVKGGRSARYYKSKLLNTVDLKRLMQISANEEGKVTKVSLERLNDFELQERLIACDTVVTRLDKGLIERINIIKGAIQDKRKLGFFYVKGNQGINPRTVEPVGLIKDGRHTVMIAFNEEKELRAYTVMKMLKLFKKHNDKHFIPLSQSDAIKVLHSGIEEHFRTDHKEHIVLDLSSKAVDLFSEERPRFCDDWQFEYTDSMFRKARVSFKRRLSVKFIEDLMSLGNHIKVISSARLIDEIRNNQLDLNRVG